MDLAFSLQRGSHAHGMTAHCEAVSIESVIRDDRLIRAWEELESAAVLPTQSYCFNAELSKTMLAGAHTRIFMVHGPDSAHGVDAVFPLCRGDGFFARWRMIGACEVYEPGDALCHGPEAALLLADAIAQENRPIRLDRVPVNSPLIPALKARMKRRGWVSERPAAPFPTITLDGRWTAPETRFNTGRQSDFRRARRRAEQFGHVSFSVHTPSVDEFDALFDEAIGVEMRSWKKETGSALAISRANGDFFRRYFRSACDHQAVRIAFMRINGRPVAMQLAMLSSDRFWLFKIGHDESFGRCSPGTLLMLHTLGYAASIGLRGYEYLGSTERWIADFWTQEQHECVRLRTYPFNARGAGALLADGAQWLWRRMRGAAG